MSKILPQQKLLLELLVMSGDIGISSEGEYEILDRTLSERVDVGYSGQVMAGFGTGKRHDAANRTQVESRSAVTKMIVTDLRSLLDYHVQVRVRIRRPHCALSLAVSAATSATT